MRTKLFSVTIADCRVDTFTVGGHGGSGKDTSNTGVRITHTASGATGRAVENRSQLANKRLAFARMAESKEFKSWVKLQASKTSTSKSTEQLVDEWMEPENLKVEVFEDGNWKDAT
jgi:protein subunit release factor A